MTKGSAALQTAASCIGPGHTFPLLGRGALFCQLSSSGALGFSHTGHLGLLLAQNCAKAGCGLPGPLLRLQGQMPLLVPSRCSVNVRQTGTPACLELRVRWMVVSAKGERAGSGTGILESATGASSLNSPGARKDPLEGSRLSRHSRVAREQAAQLSGGGAGGGGSSRGQQVQRPQGRRVPEQVRGAHRARGPGAPSARGDVSKGDIRKG